MALLRISILPVFLFAAACTPRHVVCPAPEQVKLQKSTVRLSSIARKATRDNIGTEKTFSYDYFQKPETEPKALKNIEIWDCPRPGLKHNKMVARKAAQLQKRYDKYLKKVARYSEVSTTMVYEKSKNE